MIAVFTAWKNWITDKVSAFAAKVKIRKKLDEIEKLAVNTGKNMKTGLKKLLPKKQPPVPAKKKKNPFVVAVGVLGSVAALFLVLVSVFYLCFSLAHGRKHSRYVSVKRK